MKPTNKEELSELLKILSKNGVETYEIDGFKLCLQNKEKPKQKRNTKAKEDDSPIEGDQKPWTEEQTLFWSSGEISEAISGQ